MLAVAFIKNKEKLYLIQKTSKEKGGKYSSTEGHVVHGELVHHGDEFGLIARRAGRAGHDHDPEHLL